MIRSILLDVGGPVLDEVADFQRVDEVLLDLLRREGLTITDEAFTRARDSAITSYSPSYNSATIWRFVEPDLTLFRSVRRELNVHLREMRRTPLLQHGVVDVIRELASRYRIGLAGNQPPEVRQALDDLGVLQECASAVLSDEIGVSKPDTRFYLGALKALDAVAHETVMVGDRLDNDIYPANTLGMHTVRILTGPFAQQRPRTPRDMPRETISSIIELPTAIERISHDLVD
jgi:putative hydrolase of the HAD superfamily